MSDIFDVPVFETGALQPPEKKDFELLEYVPPTYFKEEQKQFEKDWLKKTKEKISDTQTKFQVYYEEKYGRPAPDLDYDGIIIDIRQAPNQGKMPELSLMDKFRKKIRKSDSFLSKFFDKPNSPNETAVARNEFIDYFIKENKKRWNNLTDVGKQIELKLGGIWAGAKDRIEDREDPKYLYRQHWMARGQYAPNFSFRMDSFEKGFNEEMTLELLSKKDPVYDDAVGKEYSGFYGAGKTIGAILNFMLLSKAANVVKIPSTLQKMARTSDVARYGLKALGTPKYYTGLLTGKLGLIKYANTLEAGIHGATSGFVGAFQEGIKHTARKLRNEDKMSKREWHNSLPWSLTEGFFNKYFVGVINDPGNWPTRALGDAVYGLGEQYYRVATGQQDEIKLEDYIMSVIKGHVLGEIQGRMFAPNRAQLEAEEKYTLSRHYSRIVEEQTGFTFPNQASRFLTGNSIYQASLRHKQLFRKPLTKEQVLKTANKTGIALSFRGGKGYDALVGISHPDRYSVSLEDYSKIMQGNRNEALRSLNKYYKLDPEQIQQLRAERVIEQQKASRIKELLKQWGKTEPEVKKIPEPIKPAGMSQNEWFYQRVIKNVNKIGSLSEDKLYNFFTKQIGKDTAKKLYTPPVTKSTPYEPPPAARDIPDTRSPEQVRKEWNTFLYKKDNKGRTGYRRLQEYANKAAKSFRLPNPEETAMDLISETSIHMESKPTIQIKENIEKYARGIIRNKASQLVRENIREEQITEILKNNTPGIDYNTVNPPPDYKAQERLRFAHGTNYLLKEYAKRSKLNTHRAIAYHIYNIKNKGYTQEDIAGLFNAAGIKDSGKPVTRRSINRWIDHAKKALYNLALSGKVESKNPFIRTKKTYTSKDHNKIINEAIEKYNSVNRITGIDNIIDDDFFVSRLEKSGSYILELRDHASLKRLYGENVANQVLWKAGNILKNEIYLMNNTWFPKNDNAKLYLKNPDDYSTRFVLYSNNISNIQFNQAASHLYKILSNNFDPQVNPEKVFAVIVHKPKGAQLITNFKGTDVMFILQQEDILKPYTILKNKRATLTSYIPQEDIPEVKNDFIQDSPEQMENTLQSKIRLNEPESEGMMAEILKEFKVDTDWGDVALKGFGKQREQLRKEGISGTVKSIEDHWKRDFTIYEGYEMKQDFRPLIQNINRWSYFADEVGMDINTIIAKAHGNFRAPLLNENQINAYRVMLKFVKELEGKKLMNLKNPEDLNKPDTYKLSKNIESHKDLTDDVILELINNSKDDFKYSKILVQKFGINPRDLIEVMERTDRYCFKPMEDLYHKSVRHKGLQGNNANADYISVSQTYSMDKVISSLKSVSKDDIHAQKIEESFTKMFNSQKGLNTIKAALERLPEGRFKIEGQRAMELYEKISPENISYFHHNILGHKDNQVKFDGQIKRYINGGVNRGEFLADPIIKEMMNRKIPTLEEAIKAGYIIERDSIATLHASMRYLLEKRANQIMVENMKETFLKRFEQAYNTSINEKDKRYIFEFFENEAMGYFYLPSKTEFSYYRKIAKNLESKIEAIKMKGITSGREIGDYSEYETRLADTEAHIARLQRLKNTYQVYTTKEGTMTLTPEAKQLNLTFEDRQELSTRLLAEEQFIPMNWYSFITEDRSNLEHIMPALTTRLGKLHAPNLTNWDGIYTSRILHKGLRTFVFRNDYLNKNYDFEYQSKAMKLYDTVNKHLKLIRFYKPTIMAQNDMVQGLLANPAYIKHMSFGFKATNKKHDRTNYKQFTELALRFKDTQNKTDADALVQFIDNNPGIFHRLMGRNNLYNKPVAMEIYPNAIKATLQLMNKDNVFGAIADDASGQKGLIKKLGIGWKGWQNVTWQLDESIRTSVARPMFERFFRASGDLKQALQDSADWTNLFMVEYSRMPTYTRQKLNRFFLVPTYRIQTWRMYKEMFKLAGSGIKRAFTGKGQDRYKVSEDRFKQSLFEMGPLARKFASTGAVKLMLHTLFGYTFENIFDIIFGYRMKKYSWTHSLLKDELEFVSLSTPLFQIEKFITRARRAPTVLLKYNAAAFPGLLWALCTNRNLITGKKIITADIPKQPAKALGQLAADMLRTYMPLGSDIWNWADSDVSLTKKVINTFGLGFFYKADSPYNLLRTFEEASSKAKTPEEHQKILKEFNYKYGRAHEVLFDEKFKTIQEEIQEMRGKYY